jgi:hypothetical protein
MTPRYFLRALAEAVFLIVCFSAVVIVMGLAGGVR